MFYPFHTIVSPSLYLFRFALIFIIQPICIPFACIHLFFSTFVSSNSIWRQQPRDILRDGHPNLHTTTHLPGVSSNLCIACLQPNISYQHTSKCSSISSNCPKVPCNCPNVSRKCPKFPYKCSNVSSKCPKVFSTNCDASDGYLNISSSDSFFV
jgi:hypothetical protein